MKFPTAGWGQRDSLALCEQYEQVLLLPCCRGFVAAFPVIKFQIKMLKSQMRTLQKLISRTA